MSVTRTTPEARFHAGAPATASSGDRVEGRPHRSVGPGFARTPLLDRPEMTDEVIDMLVQMHPIGRLGSPEEIGEVIAWLCGDAPALLNGAYIPVDGGYLTR